MPLEPVPRGTHNCIDVGVTSRPAQITADLFGISEQNRRVPGSPRQVGELLARHGLVAAVTEVPANLEEAFVSLVTVGPRP